MRNDLKQYILNKKDFWKRFPEFKKNGIAMLARLIICESEIGDFVFLSGDWIARQIGISESYLSRCFKGFYNSLLSDHILWRKMAAAKELLLQCPDLSIEEIAGKLDYCDGNYFIKVFKKKIKMTPLQFRLEYAKGKEKPRKCRGN